MDTNIVLVYCLCDDLLKWQHHRDDPQCALSDAEVMTIAIVAAMYFGGNQALARLMLSEQGYIKQAISRSRLSRRLARTKHQFLTLFNLLGDMAKAQNGENIYIIDSLPVAVCDNYRIRRCKLYRNECYRGCQASKKRYFYGLKLHLLVTKAGEPVEFLLSPGAWHDAAALDQFDFDLPPEAWIVADKAYNVYLVEDIMAACNCFLLPLRKHNSKRPHPGWLQYLLTTYRKAVETAGSQIERLLPKHIHAVTADGFELKVILFVLASAIFVMPTQ
jgi:hypothetical protein